MRGERDGIAQVESLLMDDAGDIDAIRIVGLVMRGNSAGATSIRGLAMLGVQTGLAFGLLQQGAFRAQGRQVQRGCPREYRWERQACHDANL